MTNSPFSLNIEVYENMTALINDFKAVSLGIAGHLMGLEEISIIQIPHPDGSLKDAVKHGNISIHGAGTGLGVGRLFWIGDRYFSPASEGGHKLFSPDSDNGDEREIYEYVRKTICDGKMPHSEVLISGIGSMRIFEFLSNRDVLHIGDTSSNSELTGEQNEEFKRFKNKYEGLSKMAKKYPESVFERADDLFYEFYGRAIRDNALHEFATGGVYVAGGIIRKNIETEPGSGIVDERISGSIMKGFYSGDTHLDLLASFQVNAILDKEVGLKGAKYVCLNEREFEEAKPRG